MIAAHVLFASLALIKAAKEREGNNLEFIIHDAEIFVSKICWPTGRAVDVR